MRTSYRDLFLLACCQALLLINAAGLITMNGLVGYDLAGTKSLATLGVTTYVLEKRNHPKNNEPMLVLDGQAFVTFYQKPPWR